MSYVKSLTNKVWKGVLDPDKNMIIIREVFIQFVLYEDRSDGYVTNIAFKIVLNKSEVSGLDNRIHALAPASTPPPPVCPSLTELSVYQRVMHDL